jgi:hypothetical protein
MTVGEQQQQKVAVEDITRHTEHHQHQQDYLLQSSYSNLGGAGVAAGVTNNLQALLPAYQKGVWLVPADVHAIAFGNPAVAAVAADAASTSASASGDFTSSSIGTIVGSPYVNSGSDKGVTLEGLGENHEVGSTSKHVHLWVSSVEDDVAAASCADLLRQSLLSALKPVPPAVAAAAPAAAPAAILEQAHGASKSATGERVKINNSNSPAEEVSGGSEQCTCVVAAWGSVLQLLLVDHSWTTSSNCLMPQGSNPSSNNRDAGGGIVRVAIARGSERLVDTPVQLQRFHAAGGGASACACTQTFLGLEIDLASILPTSSSSTTTSSTIGLTGRAGAAVLLLFILPVEPDSNIDMHSSTSSSSVLEVQPSQAASAAEATPSINSSSWAPLLCVAVLVLPPGSACEVQQWVEQQHLGHREVGTLLQDMALVLESGQKQQQQQWRMVVDLHGSAAGRGAPDESSAALGDQLMNLVAEGVVGCVEGCGLTLTASLLRDCWGGREADQRNSQQQQQLQQKEQRRGGCDLEPWVSSSITEHESGGSEASCLKLKDTAAAEVEIEAAGVTDSIIASSSSSYAAMPDRTQIEAKVVSSAVVSLDTGVARRPSTLLAAAKAAKPHQARTGGPNAAAAAAAAAGVSVSPAEVAALRSWGVEGLRVCWKGFGGAVESEYLVSKAVRYRTWELLMMVFQVIMGLVFAVKYFTLLPWQQHYFGLFMGEC